MSTIGSVEIFELFRTVRIMDRGQHRGLRDGGSGLLAEEQQTEAAGSESPVLLFEKPLLNESAVERIGTDLGFDLGTRPIKLQRIDRQVVQSFRILDPGSLLA